MTFKNAESIKTQAQAMAYLKKLGKSFTVSEIVIRYARREMALAKDKANRKAGKAARLYLNRQPKKLPAKIRATYAKVAKVAEEMRSVH